MEGGRVGRTSGALLVAAGIVVLVVVGAGVVSSAFLVDDLAYVAGGGLGGLACVTVGVTLLLTSRSAARTRDFDRIAEALRRPSPTGDETPVTSAAPSVERRSARV